MQTLSGVKLKNLRQARDISQEDLAIRANKYLDDNERFPINAKSLISQWENHGPSIRSEVQKSRVQALAWALKCNYGDLLVGDTDERLKWLGEQETQRLLEYGFVPGFFSFIASSLGCVSIETYAVRYCRRLNRGWIDPDWLFGERFQDGITCIFYDATTGAITDGGPARRYLRYKPRGLSLDDGTTTNEMVDTLEDGAILHFQGKKNDRFVALSDLLQLQERLGSFARFSMKELLDKSSKSTN